MKNVVFAFMCSVVLLAGTSAPAAADYPGCVVNEGDSIVDGRLVYTFDNDYFGFTVRPHETVCFSVLKEGDYVARTEEGFELGSLSVDANEPFEFQGKQVYWVVEIGKGVQ